jgi:hypothetical protein
MYTVFRKRVSKFRQQIPVWSGSLSDWHTGQGTNSVQDPVIPNFHIATFFFQNWFQVGNTVQKFFRYTFFVKIWAVSSVVTARTEDIARQVCVIWVMCTWYMQHMFEKWNTLLMCHGKCFCYRFNLLKYSIAQKYQNNFSASIFPWNG